MPLSILGTLVLPKSSGWPHCGREHRGIVGVAVGSLQASQRVRSVARVAGVCSDLADAVFVKFESVVS